MGGMSKFGDLSARIPSQRIISRKLYPVLSAFKGSCQIEVNFGNKVFVWPGEEKQKNSDTESLSSDEEDYYVRRRRRRQERAIERERRMWGRSRSRDGGSSEEESLDVRRRRRRQERAIERDTRS